MLVTDPMDVRTMALIATAVTIERLAPKRSWSHARPARCSPRPACSRSRGSRWAEGCNLDKPLVIGGGAKPSRFDCKKEKRQ